MAVVELGSGAPISEDNHNETSFGSLAGSIGKITGVVCGEIRGLSGVPGALWVGWTPGIVPEL